MTVEEGMKKKNQHPMGFNIACLCLIDEHKFVDICIVQNYDGTSKNKTLTTSLQNNSILSSGGICDPSEMLSF